MEGWVKNHRQIKEWKYYKKDGYAHLWQHIIREAKYSETTNKLGQVIIRGQLDTGRKRLSEETGLHPSKVERILTILENEQQIEQQKTNQNRVITILNYDQFQAPDNELNNQRTTSEQRANNERTHSKKVKKDKKEKKEKKVASELEFLGQELQAWIGEVPANTLNRWFKSHKQETLLREIESAYLWDHGRTEGKRWSSPASGVNNWLKKVAPDNYDPLKEFFDSQGAVPETDGEIWWQKRQAS